MWNKDKYEKINMNAQTKKITGENELICLINHMIDPEYHAYEHGFVDFLNCKECNGKYILRDGKYGLFYGCSNYPKCHSTRSIADLTYSILLENGLAIYEFEIECWKCHKTIKIISYFPYFDFCSIDSNLIKIDQLSIIRLSVLDGIDKILEDDYSHVKKVYSKKAGFSYVANTCQHCGALQGSTMTLQNVFEKLNEAFKTKSVKQFITKRIVINQNVLSKVEWEEIIKQIKDNN